MSEKILVINPGSTSTKISVYEDKNEVFTETISHSAEELVSFNKIADQFDFRSLAFGILRILEGKEQAKEYTGI